MNDGFASKNFLSKRRIIIFVAIYLLVSVAIFTIFMGVPIFNIFVGILGGYYLIKQNVNAKIWRNYRRFSFAILLAVFIVSAFLALTDKYTAANLEGMFNLNFQITTLHIWLIILVGGSSFLFANDFLISRISKKASRE